uniref:Uncharacterized protein n=1 Tax=Sphaerodactylus townsendi TaxID=933632 RepID=A0ACB8FJ68_9SAUR
MGKAPATRTLATPATGLGRLGEWEETAPASQRADATTRESAGQAIGRSIDVSEGQVKRECIGGVMGKPGEGMTAHKETVQDRSLGRARGTAEPIRRGSESLQLGRGRLLRAGRAFKRGNSEVRELPLQKGDRRVILGGSERSKGVRGLSRMGRLKAAQAGELAEAHTFWVCIANSRGIYNNEIDQVN